MTKHYACYWKYKYDVNPMRLLICILIQIGPASWHKFLVTESLLKVVSMTPGVWRIIYYTGPPLINKNKVKSIHDFINAHCENDFARVSSAVRLRHLVLFEMGVASNICKKVVFIFNTGILKIPDSTHKACRSELNKQSKTTYFCCHVQQDAILISRCYFWPLFERENKKLKKY